MQFNGQKIGALTEIIKQSFNTASFTQFLTTRLDKNIDDYTGVGDPFPFKIFNVLKGANMEGWNIDLVHALLTERPKNKLLQLFTLDIGEVKDLAYNDDPARADALEKIINTDPLLDPATFLNGLTQAKKCVCRIEVPEADGKISYGTGFLISKDVVMTNFHVLEGIINNQALIEKTVCRFDYEYLANGSLNKGIEVGLADNPILHTSKYSSLDENPPADINANWPQDQLDYAIVRLKNAVGLEPFGLNSEKSFADDQNIRGWIKEVNPDKAALEKGKHMIILQHPKSQPLKIAIGMSKIMSRDANYRRIRYNINTEPGSSGSAGFDENFKWISLHNLGDPEWVPSYNQGITAISIINDLKLNQFIDFDICK
ncbi:trypsin-like peptidase domain-containing protein [Pedobacter psychrodurus]|uniref:trypsin-like peptidase domain-containing protein n=1 Tax=Pedobacter psychrodurus TaxID=2530456 RepID=UPI00292CF1EF|nr:trypsin-like peptidase domain-containing protein [Pedobacter psychrodurus]